MIIICSTPYQSSLCNTLALFISHSNHQNLFWRISSGDDLSFWTSYSWSIYCRYFILLHTVEGVGLFVSAKIGQRMRTVVKLFMPRISDPWSLVKGERQSILFPVGSRLTGIWLMGTQRNHQAEKPPSPNYLPSSFTFLLRPVRAGPIAFGADGKTEKIMLQSKSIEGGRREAKAAGLFAEWGRRQAVSRQESQQKLSVSSAQVRGLHIKSSSRPLILSIQ